MSFSTLARKVVKSITLRAAVKLSARLTARLIFYSLKTVKDPRITIPISIGVTVASKASTSISKKYKRTNFDEQAIFEDSIDAIHEAF